MSGWKIEHTTAVALVAAVAMPVGLVLAARHVSRQMEASSYWVTHSQEIAQELDQLRIATALQAAAAKPIPPPVPRDFADTRAQTARANALLAKLREQTRDNPTQVSNVAKLQMAVDRVSADADALLNARARRTEEPDAALAARAASDFRQMQAEIAVVGTAEDTLMAGRRAELRVLSGEWQRAFYVTCIASLLLLLLAFASLVLEIRRRRRLEAALRANREQLDFNLEHYERLLANVPAVVWILTSYGRLEYVSDRVQEAFGLQPSAGPDAAGAWFEYWIAPEEHPQVAAALHRLFEKGTPVSLVVHLQPFLGKWRCAQLEARRVRRPDGVIVADGVLLNLTERERVRQLEEAQQAAAS